MLGFSQRSFYLVVFLFLTVMVNAQSSTSRITGTVNDINGSAIEGATVTLTNEATGVAFTQVTTNDGVFAFTSLTAGRYSIAVEQSGFKKTIQTGNVLEVSTPLNVNLVLEIGGVNEVVTIVSDRETIQSNTAT